MEWFNFHYRFFSLLGMAAASVAGLCSLQGAESDSPEAEPGNLPVPELRSQSGDTVKAGYLTLEWSLPDESGNLPEGMEFVLQEDSSRQFPAPNQRFRGRDFASFVTGLPNGEYWFRVRVVDADDGGAGNWSEPVMVTVAHHSLGKAFLLMSIGAVVFVATVIVILVGNARAEFPPQVGTETTSKHQPRSSSGGA